MHIDRILTLAKLRTSAFLFGPRMTGKTTLLNRMTSDEYFNLLDPELELLYRSKPGTFWEQISALPNGSMIIIDEIQKIPVLLNYVQMGIDQLDHRYILSGSSARKLRRGGANLLGGRALELKLHPFIFSEVEKLFNLEQALQFGMLPKIFTLLIEGDKDLAQAHLKSYITTYIKEEIQAEALTRNIGSFQRFLTIAAQSNGQVIEFSNISRESSVPASTVKEYYQILEDTLIGFFLWPFDSKERKKARPKSYFFDCGVVRAIQNRLQDPPTAREKGFLFETWMINELISIRDYYNKPHEFSFWREKNHEVDILISSGHGPILAIECKSGSSEISKGTISKFRERFPKVPLIVASLSDTKKRKVGQVEVIPWKEVLQLYLEM